MVRGGRRPLEHEAPGGGRATRDSVDLNVTPPRKHERVGALEPEHLSLPDLKPTTRAAAGAGHPATERRGPLARRRRYIAARRRAFFEARVRRAHVVVPRRRRGGLAYFSHFRRREGGRASLRAKPATASLTATILNKRVPPCAVRQTKGRSPSFLGCLLVCLLGTFGMLRVLNCK